MSRFLTKEKLSSLGSNYGSRENSLKKKNPNIFVDCKRPKPSQKDPYAPNVGFEYDCDVFDDKAYCRKIIEKNCYYADYNSPILNKISTQTIQKIALSEVKNRKTDNCYEPQDGYGSPAYPLRLAVSLTGKEPDLTIAKYTRQKLAKKIKNQEDILMEEVYIIKLKWLIKMAKIQEKTHKHNLNNFRLTLEEIIEEASTTFDIQLFQSQKQIMEVLRKLSHFLAKLESQKAILLSYKLFKMHLKQLDLEDPQSKIEVATKLHTVLLPYIKLMEIKEVHKSEKDHKERTNLVTYKKIQKFSLEPKIADILLEHPNPKKFPEYRDKFKDFLSERVSYEKALARINLKNKEIIEEKPIASIRECTKENFCSPEVVDCAESPKPIEKRFSFHLENARSFEIDESCVEPDKNTQNIRNYDFLEKCKLGKANKCFGLTMSLLKKNLLGTPELKKNGSKDSDNRLSGYSSNPGEDDESDQELMQDPELYQPNPQEKTKQQEEPIILKNIPASNFGLRQKKVSLYLTPLPLGEVDSPSPRKKLLTPIHINKQSSGNKEAFMCCDDLDTKADPLRVARKPELVKMNSFDGLTPMEGERSKQKDELKSPVEKHRHEELLNPRRRPSICQKHLAITKTKKEIMFQKIINIAFDEVSKWDSVINTQNIRIQKIRPENSPVVLLRAWTFIEGFTPKEIFEQIYDTDQRAKWDTVTVGLHVIEPIDESSEIIYFYIKTPFGITEREFVQRRDYRFDYPEKDTIIMSFQSCQHPAKPTTKNRIRGETHLAGYLIKPSTRQPGSTDLCILSQVDIKGSVPKAIVNMIAAKAPADWVNKLKKACERARASRK